MDIKVLNRLSTTIALGILTTATGFSAMITGLVTVTGSASVSATAIDFFNTPPPCTTPTLGGGTNGCFLVVGTPTGNFTGLSSPSGGVNNGTILDLVGGNITGSKNIQGFMTFSNSVIFDLVNLPAAGNPGCSTVDPTLGGVSCVPDGNGPSAFRLTNGPGTGAGQTGPANTVAVQFTVGLNGYTGSNAVSTPYIGIFATTISNANAATILASLAANGGTGSFGPKGFSADFSPAAVPEPATMLLMGFGLLGVSFASRKFPKR